MLKLYRFLKPHLHFAIAAIVLVIAQSLTTLMLPRLMASIVDYGIVQKNTEFIFYQGIRMLVVTLVGGLCAVAGSFASAKAGSLFGRDLRLAVFSTIQHYSMDDFDKMGASTLITRSSNDTGQVQGFVQMSMHMLARAPIMMGVSLIFAISLNRELALVFLVSLPVLVTVFVLITKFGLPLFKQMQEKTDALNLILRESLSGIRVIRAFTREEPESKRFDRANVDLTQTSLKAQRLMMILMPIMDLVMNLTTIAIMVFAAPLIAGRKLEIGSLMAFIQYAGHVLFSLMVLSSLFVSLPRAQISANRINELFALGSPTTAETKEAQRGQRHVPLTPSTYGQLEISKLSFRYPGASELALKNLDIAFKSGKINAIIGGTGSGKTSLLNLLLRFYEPEAGTISLNGSDIAPLSEQELRQYFAYVPQKAGLLSGSLRENLYVGRAEASDEELWRALEVAQAKAFVQALPEGIDSDLAQSGRNLSGGQKQRIAIARALVRDAQFYLFDDSFSALDFATDAALRRALSQELQLRAQKTGRPATVIIVAQRINTIVHADHIVVLDRGSVVGQGRHEELLAGCPIYREIVDSQFDISEAEVLL